MLYWLIALSDRLSVLNVFRYLTFRAVGAVVTALIFVFLFGPTIINSAGRVVPVRQIGEQHVMEDLGRIPTAADWLREIRLAPWMLRRSRADIPKEGPAGSLPILPGRSPAGAGG